MPKKVINSFNAGELSPYLYARTDLDKYGSGCLVMENFVPLPYGGVTRRPALEYLGDSKQDDKVRLIPFTASVEGSYVLELGTGYVRFWKDGALVEVLSIPVEVGSPYDDSELAGIKVAQSVDVMWLVHPNHTDQRLSRLSDTSWTMTDEAWVYPPLLEENQTDITLSPSGTTGTIVLTSSQDFFDIGHVGGFFAFDSPRNTSEAAISGNFTTTNITDDIYVSLANWEFSTTGSWRGRVVIQRSLNAGISWEDYIVIGDTTDVSTSPDGRKNFSIASDAPEPVGARIRMQYIDNDGTISYQLKTADQWKTLVKIGAFTDAQNVTAEVIDEFQDVVADYTDWATSTGYSKGDKVLIDGGLEYSSTNVNLTAINAGLTDIVGADFAGGFFWVVTNGSGNQKLWKLDSGLTAVESGFPVDIGAAFSEVGDIAYYSNELYICGATDPRSWFVRKYDIDGVFISNVVSPGTLPAHWAGSYVGLGYYMNNFYLSYSWSNPSTVQNGSVLAKYSTSWIYSGTQIFKLASGSATRRDSYSDISGYNSILYVSDAHTNFINSLNESLVNISSQDVSLQTTEPKGTAWDGVSLWVFDEGGVAYKYNLISSTTYYECTTSHTSGSFGTDFGNGKWSVREPAIRTWTEGAFSDYRGHPASIALFESRLVYGGTAFAPDTLWLSQIDDFSNFALGSLATDALKLTLNSGKFDGIQWLVPQERLVIGTSGSEWSLGADDERKAITPTGFDLKRKTTYGNNGVQGVLVNSAILLLMRQGRKVREWTPNYNLQDYVAPDLTILAEHITEGGILQWDYQQQPDNVLWSIRSDGTLLGFTYERDQNVTGWHRHVSSEFDFESVAIIPRSNEEDEIWVSIKITVDSVVKRYIGRLNDREWGSDFATEWQGSDLYKEYSFPEGSALTGLEYLDGKTVVVSSESTVIGTAVVSNGEIPYENILRDDDDINLDETINLDPSAHVVVGLPFTSTLAPLFLDVESQYGTTKGSKKDNRKAVIRYKDTFSAKAGQKLSSLEDVNFDQDESPLYNGDREVWYDNESDFLLSCYIVQEDPMPCTILCAIPNVEVRG